MADNKHDQAATVTRRSATQAGALLASGVPLFWSGGARADKAKSRRRPERPGHFRERNRAIGM
jgi:hypothetical protein